MGNGQGWLSTETKLLWNVDLGSGVAVVDVAVETVAGGLAAMIVTADIDSSQ